MKNRNLALVVCVALFPATFAFAAGGDEKAVRDADAQWPKVAAARDLDKTVSFYADDVIVLPPNQAPVATKDGTKDRGKYCEVWRRQADGKWKVSADMFSSDLPVPSASSSPAAGVKENK
jgi:ketosteroid isomerase-like protein